MGNYKEFVKEMKTRVTETGSKRFSRGELTDVVKELLNDPTHEVEVFGKDAGRSVVKSNPSKDFRDALKPVVKSFGVDSNELGKLDTLEFPKKLAEATANVALHATKDYIDTGRTLALPLTSKKESEMKFCVDMEPKKVRETKKPVKKADGTYESVPTGKIVTTAAHARLKAKNSVPFWLKTSSDVK